MTLEKVEYLMFPLHPKLMKVNWHKVGKHTNFFTQAMYSRMTLQK
ncbi:hypothetical protein [Coxiella endosymbiont of Rhipicephalus microplus]|nr:hypothetical protein [Coxiella endosymbiont of Rhipicephalus microplus]PMB54903.1 hypothetical protein CLERM_165 [Coxiella-like endosymbiont]